MNELTNKNQSKCEQVGDQEKITSIFGITSVITIQDMSGNRQAVGVILFGLIAIILTNTQRKQLPLQHGLYNMC